MVFVQGFLLLLAVDGARFTFGYLPVGPRSAFVSAGSIRSHNSALERKNNDPKPLHPCTKRRIGNTENIDQDFGKLLKPFGGNSEPRLFMSTQEKQRGSTLYMRSAVNVHPSDVSPGFFSGIAKPLRAGQHQKKHKQACLAMMLAGSVRPSNTFPGFSPDIRKLKDRRTSSFSGLHSSPLMIATSMHPSDFRPGYLPKFAGDDLVLETKSLESLTEDERKESLDKFELDWANGNPLDPSYDPNRLEDVLILLKQRQDGSLVGFAYGRRVNVDLWWLDKFMVTRDRQSKGLGFQLVRRFLDYIVTEKHARAFFSSTQLHRIGSLKAQRKAYDDFISGLDKYQIMPPGGVGYYHFDEHLLKDPPSALVLFPLSKSVTLTDVSEWTRLILQDKYHPTAARMAHNFRDFLEKELFNYKFASSDPVKVLAGILEEQNFPSDKARELAKIVLPMVDSLDWGI